MRRIGTVLAGETTTTSSEPAVHPSILDNPQVQAARLFWSQPCPRGCHLGRVRDPESVGVTGRWVYCDCAKGSRARQRDAENEGRAIAERAAERRETMQARVARRLGELPEAYQEYTLESSPLARHQAMRQVRAFLARWNGTQDLILQGAYGVGKTGLLVGILRALTDWMAECETDFLLLDSVKLTREMNDALRGREDVGQLLNSYKRVGVLAIDDVGVERSLGPVTQAYWYELLNERYVRRRATLMTTNLTPGELADFLGERIMARLTERGSIVVIDQAKDIRKARRMARVSGEA